MLVLVEGSSEADYFGFTRREERLRLIEVVLDSAGGVPKTLVERAAARKKEAQREARRRRDASVIYDEVWCVFDVDAHPNLEEARVQARDNGIKIAVSNPCFELWLVLHFKDQSAHIHRHALQHKCSTECIPDFGKRITEQVYGVLREKYEEAVDRARRLDNWHGTRGTEGQNPSTSVYKLTERLRNVRRTEHQARE